ncbi:hypothetical protein GCK72_026273 [Caenorhabditis remanei]|uniref:Uncharacterized protein n=1 Tax=Caenorhabditis remanei TaxID=31234 RepID=A0A6A5G5D4_CAERE|nr:hypothetical protein GCK72_026273 [Caenorhabditis remanei]KAF1749804.1 hypothetical protein GCK72_026273 [Caenorhabditis remanei]
MDASNTQEFFDPLPPLPRPPDFWQPAEKSSVQLHDYSRNQNTPAPMDIATTPSPVPPPARNCLKSEYSKLFREVEAAARRRPEHPGETWEEVREKTRIAWTRLLAFESKKKGLDYLDDIVDKKIDKKFPNWRDPNFKPPVRSRSSSREPRKDGSDGVIQKGEFRRHNSSFGVMFSLQYFVFVFFLTGNLLGLVYQPDTKSTITNEIISNKLGNEQEVEGVIIWSLNELLIAVHSRNYDKIKNLLHADVRYKRCDSTENRDNSTASSIVFKAVFTAKMEEEERTGLVQMTLDKKLLVFTEGQTIFFRSTAVFEHLL